MNLKSSKKVDVNKYELEVEISAEDFNKELSSIYQRNIKKIVVPGFRKGKAPKAFVEKYYGENVFFEDALNNLYPDAIEKAVEEAKLDIVEDKIDLEVEKMGKEDGVVFKAKITVMPEVEIGNYKGIEVSKKEVKVEDEDVEKELKSVQERNGRLVTVSDRAAQLGDSVVIDFEGFMDGKAFEGGKGDNFTLELGKKQFIEGFEDQIVGHNAGEEFEINVKFPEDYHAKNYAGKDATFKIKLHEIKMHELPELDDEFVKDVSEFDTLDEYKKDIKAKLLERKEKQAKDEKEGEMIEKLISLVKAEIPEALIKNKLRDLVRDFDYRMQSQGLKLADYLKYTGSKMEDLENNFRPQAESQVKLQLALKKIAEIENLIPTEEDIEKEYNKISEFYKMELDKVKNIVPVKDVEKDILSNKALEIVRENSVEK